MKNKQIKLNTEARSSLLKGIEILSKSVGITLGPAGRNVVIETEYEMPYSTKDGVTVAKAIKLKDSFENTGAQLVKEAAIQTNDSVGDGTTTAVILAHEIISEGLKTLTNGVNAIELKRGIEKATKYVVSELEKQSINVTNNKELNQIATISANGDEEIGKIIAEAMDEVGKDGVIMIEDAKTSETILEIVEGMQFDRGYLSPYFINNNQTMQCELENPYILIYDRKLNNLKGITKVLDQIIKTDTPLFVIAEDVEGEALAVLVVNKVRGTMKVAATKAPEFGDRRKEILEDIAVLTGGTVISADKGLSLEKLTIDQLGRARMVTITGKKTTIVDGKGDENKILDRAEEIKKQIELATSDYDKEKYQARLARFSGGVAVIQIGAESELEMKDKKYRAEDALHAVRAAVEKGILPGGGIVLMNIFNYFDDNKEMILEYNSIPKIEKRGFEILMEAIKAPFRLIIENSGKNAEAIFETIKFERKMQDSQN
ncbi:MAG: chaperonin GroEL, partial [Melioribacteraceae bacterium]|nr:chaperonin GroEL [Melioribacteraceae bacterium]